MRLDRTWRKEAIELQLTVKPGWPTWAGELTKPPEYLPGFLFERKDYEYDES